MSPRSAAECPAWSANPDSGLVPGSPWTVRLSGAWSARPALELYEDGVLLDVISSTPIAPQLVRGARTAMDRARPRTLGWGRLPAVGRCPAVEFRRGRLHVHGVVTQVTDWCWVAVADGTFRRVAVYDGAGQVLVRVSRGQPWR